VVGEVVGEVSLLALEQQGEVEGVVGEEVVAFLPLVLRLV
jgi:hypothetical protein